MMIPVSALAGVADSKARGTPVSHIRRFMAFLSVLPVAFLLSRLPAWPHLFQEYLVRRGPINHACPWICLPPIRSHPSEQTFYCPRLTGWVASADFRLNARSFSGLTPVPALPRRQIVGAGLAKASPARPC